MVFEEGIVEQQERKLNIDFVIADIDVDGEDIERASCSIVIDFVEYFY